MTGSALASLIAWAVRATTSLSVKHVGHSFSGAQRIYFANHVSHLDFVVIWASLPRQLRAKTRPVAAADYWSGGLRRVLAERVFHAVLVNRPAGGDVHAAKEAVTELVEGMSGGCSLILFPEGTRGSGANVAAFHGGIAAVCQQIAGVELVPTLIEGTQRVLPKGELFPVPMLCRLTFGPPVYYDAQEPRRLFLDRLRQSLCELRDLKSSA